MAGNTKIEWADKVWNPIVGCSVVSAGCTNCYAMRMAARWRAVESSPYFALTRTRKGKGPVWTGDIAQAPETTLTAPLRWRKPARVFVNSMGDLFHEDAPDAWIDQVFAVMAIARDHLFMVLTKRPDRMRAYIDGDQPNRTVRIMKQMKTWPLPNVWLGVSVEDQPTADARIPDLLATPAAGRFVSAEPLLGPIDLRYLQPSDPPCEIDALNGTHGVIRPHGGENASLDLVITGGESGPGAREMRWDWPRQLRDQCAEANVPFHFKQWGEWIDYKEVSAGFTNRSKFDDAGACVDARIQLHSPFKNGFEPPAETFPWHDRMVRVGKRAAGRTLDGRTHDDLPPMPTDD